MFIFKATGNGLKPLNLKWWEPTQKQWSPVLLKDQRTPWTHESDPTTGRAWAALSPKYASAKAKKYPGQPILRATGKMEDTSFIRPWKEGFEVVSTPYGAYHQFGTSRMVARPWMGIPDVSLIKIVPIAWANILKK